MGEQDTAQCWPDTLVFWEISAICFHKVRGENGGAKLVHVSGGMVLLRAA